MPNNMQMLPRQHVNGKQKRNRIMHSQLLEGLKCESQTKNNERVKSRGTLPGSQHFGRVKGRARAPGWDQEELTSFTYSHGCAQNQHKVVSASWSTFGARTNHGQFRLTRLTTAWTWGKPPLSPLQYTLRLSMKPTSKWHFVPGFPSGSPETAKIGTHVALGAHNFACRPWIEMRAKEKLQPPLRAFQQYVARHLKTSKPGRFPTFSGRESNCQFDS